ncbi:MAG: hypothetical protein V3W41_12785 [Planctomycetota bacterium]
MLFRLSIAAIILISVPLFTSCGSTPKPEDEDWVQGYEHGFDYLWDESLSVLKQRYEMATAVPAKQKMTTEWDTQLAYFSEQGERVRLSVEFEERPVVGWVITTTEERQINTNQLNPTVGSEADWEDADPDGSATSFYRLGMAARMRPRESWRSDRERRLESESQAATQPLGVNP